MEPLYNMVHNKMVSDVSQYKDGAQKCIQKKKA